MSLRDEEILELDALCDALVDGALTRAQHARLSQWLAGSEEARRRYVRQMALSASLHEYAGEMQGEAPDRRGASARPGGAPWWWWALGGLGATAAACAIWIALFAWGDEAGGGSAVNAGEFVASLTGAKDCRWQDLAAGPRPGDHLRRGRRLDLERGVAEITFDCGARVTLEAPASIQLDSAWGATLLQGTLKANVPEEALGFRISNPAVEVVDLGTEFGVVASRNGTAEVYVIKGSVEAMPRDAAGHATGKMLLRSQQARRFARQGVSEIGDKDETLRRFARDEKLFAPALPRAYARWSFDEAAGDVAVAQVVGMAAGPLDARLEAQAGAEPEGLWTEGRWAGALRFDGKSCARVPFPGIARRKPLTIAFWVRLPAEAALSDAGTMVGWLGTVGKKGAIQPVAIAWNADPAQGGLGVVRTEFGRHCVLGTTSLRDGIWHHIGVVFVPQESGARTHIKQYVDGRLEQAAVKIGPKAHAGEPRPAPDDTLWLGREAAPAAGGGFHGEMDELFVVEGALAPQEIKSLMKTNRPRPPELARVD